MTFTVKHNGTWKGVEKAYAKYGGIWKPVQKLLIKDSGEWKEAANWISFNGIWTDFSKYSVGQNLEGTPDFGSSYVSDFVVVSEADSPSGVAAELRLPKVGSGGFAWDEASPVIDGFGAASRHQLYCSVKIPSSKSNLKFNPCTFHYATNNSDLLSITIYNGAVYFGAGALTASNYLGAVSTNTIYNFKLEHEPLAGLARAKFWEAASQEPDTWMREMSTHSHTPKRYAIYTHGRYSYYPRFLTMAYGADCEANSF